MLEIKEGTLTVGGNVVFKDLSFMALDGQITCIYGPKHCGKTALVEALLGLRPIDEGYITVDGELLSVQSSQTFRRMMAYVPQRFAFENMQVAELFDTLIRSEHQSQDDIKSQLMLQFQRLDIEHAAYEKPLCNLLNDVQQRIMLAMAYVLNRQMILLDEPMSHQSTEMCGKVWAYIREMAQKERVVLLTTTQQYVAQQADKIIDLTL